MLFVHDESSGTEVEVTGTCTHHESFYRCETHRGVHTLTVHDSRTATATTDMSGHDLLAFGIYT